MKQAAKAISFFHSLVGKTDQGEEMEYYRFANEYQEVIWIPSNALLEPCFLLLWHLQGVKALASHIDTQQEAGSWSDLTAKTKVTFPFKGYGIELSMNTLDLV